MFVRALAIGILMVGAVGVSQAAEVDARAVYAQKCGGCHFESGPEMANLKMSMKGASVVVNSTGKSVDALLKKHHKVKMTAEETASMMDLFRRGVTWEATYNQKCASCHGVAITFAREKLVTKDGVAFAPTRVATVRAVLATHGGATLKEADDLADMLREQIGDAAK